MTTARGLDTESTASKRLARPTLLLVALAYLSFVGLGFSGSMLGVAWPSIRNTFSLRLDAVGTVLLAAMVGSLLTAFSSGTLANRLGTSGLLLVGTLASVCAGFAYGLAPVWGVMVAFAFLRGVSGAAIDAGLNIYFAENHDARLMNWLHASFGVGSTLGPAAMTAILASGASWRWGYAGIAAFQVLLAVGYLLTRHFWPDPAGVSARATEAVDTSRERKCSRAWTTLAMPLTWLSMLMFMTLSGTELAAGQWAYSLFVEARDVSTAVAGFWTSVYWASLTVGRILFGLAGDRLDHPWALRASIVGIALGALLLSLPLSNGFGFAGLALMGFAYAPLFPLLQLATPRRAGARHGATLIGFQVMAAGIGAGTLPGLVGSLAVRFGLGVVGPFLLGGGLLMLLVHELIARRDAAYRPPDT